MLSKQRDILLFDNDNQYLEKIDRTAFKFLMINECCDIIGCDFKTIEIKLSIPTQQFKIYKHTKFSLKKIRPPRAKVLNYDCTIYNRDNSLLLYMRKGKFADLLYYKKGDIIPNQELSLKLVKYHTPLHGTYGQIASTFIPNICVNCGSDFQLTKHHIVPESYVKFLPKSLHTLNRVNLVIMCSACHIEYEMNAWKFKQLLNEEYFVDNRVKRKNAIGKKSAETLYNICKKADKNQISLIEERRLLDELSQKTNNLGDIIALTLTNNIEEVLDSKLIQYHSKIIANRVINCGRSGLAQFIYRWRQHFLEHVPLKHLNPVHREILSFDIRQIRLDRNDYAKLLCYD